MDNLIAFLAGWLLSWPALLVIAVLGTWFEHTDRRKSSVAMAIVGIGAVLLATVYVLGFSLLNIGLTAIAYVGCGVLWSFFRYRRYVRSQVETFNEEFKWYRPGNLAHKSGLEKLVERLKPSNNTGTIVAWIVVWPFSFVDNVIGDIIEGISTLVKTTFRRVYNHIYNSAIKNLPVVPTTD